MTFNNDRRSTLPAIIRAVVRRLVEEKQNEKRASFEENERRIQKLREEEEFKTNVQRRREQLLALTPEQQLLRLQQLENEIHFSKPPLTEPTAEELTNEDIWERWRREQLKRIFTNAL